MSDTDTATTETTTTEESADKEPAWYRDQLAKKDAEIEALTKTNNTQRVRLLESAFEAVGLDPTEGLGKAIAKEYDGEATVQGLAEFALNEYGHEAPESTTMRDDIAAGQSRVDSARNAAQSLDTSPMDIQIQEAEEAGNFASAMALKVARYREAQGI